jgi:excisionase family DNA binding protein
MICNKQNLLSVDEAAQYIHLSKHTLRAWIIQSKITYAKLGGRVLLRQEYLDEFIESSIVKNNTAMIQCIAINWR